MTLQWPLVCLAGFGAGLVNTIIGSGTLITFPALVALGVPPLKANIANNIGLAPGAVSGAHGYRDELIGRNIQLKGLVAASLVGAVVGVALLLSLPPTVFEMAAPWLIGTALLLVLIERPLGKLLTKNQATARSHSWRIWAAVFFTSIYGAYFGAGQGVILFSLLIILLRESTQKVIAIKNLLQAADNLSSALLLMVLDEPPWAVIAPLALGAVVGSRLGARVGRLLSPAAVRAVVIIVGGTALLQLVH